MTLLLLFAADGSSEPAVTFTGSASTGFVATVVTGPPAVTFTASGSLAAAGTRKVRAAAAYTASGTFASEVDRVVAWGLASFRGRGAMTVATRFFGRRRRVVVTDVEGNAFGELENAKTGAITFELNRPEEFSFVLPVDDPKASLVLEERIREVQVWRGDQLLAWGPAARPSVDKSFLAVSAKGTLWHLFRRHIGKAERTNYVPNGDFEAGLAGWSVGIKNPLEPLVNYNPALWRGEIRRDRALTGRRSIYLEQLNPTVPKYGISAGAFFVWQVDPSENPEGNEWTFVARCFIPSSKWRGPNSERGGLHVGRWSTTEVIAISPEGGGPPKLYPAPIEGAGASIDENTPRDVWIRLEARLKQPVTGEPELIGVRLECPNGAIYWDRASLTLDESTSFYGVDQATIAAELVAHLQDPDYDKSDVNLGTDTPLTGVTRDRVYLHHEHPNGWNALEEFTTLSNGFDVSVDYTPTRRTFRTHYPQRGQHRPTYALELGRNVADFAWTFDGEAASSSIVVLGTGDGSDREESHAIDPDAFSGGLTLEQVFAASPDTPIDSLDNIAAEQLATARAPEVLAVKTTKPGPGQPDPIGVLWPGDTVPVRIRVGALSVEGSYRIVRLTITPEDVLELVLNRRELAP